MTAPRKRKELSEEDRYVHKKDWMRGRVFWCEPDARMGLELEGEHYWILVSRDDINWNKRMPIIGVPIATHRKDTYVGASDIKVSVSDSPTGIAIVIRCGQVRVLDRKRVKLKGTKFCSDALLMQIKEKLIEVLGLEEEP